MSKKVINPDSVTLDDALKMDGKQWRLYTFIKLNSIENNVHKLDNRLWAVLGGVIVILATVIGNAVL